MLLSKCLLYITFISLTAQRAFADAESMYIFFSHTNNRCAFCKNVGVISANLTKFAL